MEYKNININIVLLKQNAGDGNYYETSYDFSNFVQMGSGHNICLDDTIDTMEIVLQGLPFRKPFEPTSLFRITITQEVVDENQTGTLEREYDFALQQDDVEQPNMSLEYFTHNLTLANPAIIAQQRIVDNISTTYKLQDVFLESDSEILPSLTTKIKLPYTNANYENAWLPIKNRNFGEVEIDFMTHYYSHAYKYRWVEHEINYPLGVVSETNRGIAIPNYDFTSLKNLNQNYVYGDGTPITIGGVDYPTADSIDITIPLIEMYQSVDETRDYEFVGYLPVDMVITRTNINDDTDVQEYRYTAYPSKYIEVAGESDSEIAIWNGYSIPDYPQYRAVQNYGDTGACIVAKSSETDDVLVNNEVKNRTVTINFVNNECYSYYIKFERHKMSQTISGLGVVSSTPNPYVIWQQTTFQLPLPQAPIEIKEHIYQRLEDDVDLSMEFDFNVYYFGDTKLPLFSQSKQIDAYYLFKKCQLAITPIKKTNGVPYYENETPFIVSESDKTLLERTLLNESDIIGKNLWEVFSEIGKYIHAKPKLSVVTDNDDVMTGQFLVSFLKYGSPEINTISETTNNIFNSRFSQEYICELDSYVENYFNLGNAITEWLHPSSDSDDALIYNDVVKLITRYPILEILNLSVYNSSNVSYDITKYVFEYNVYKTLSYNEFIYPSKHRAIYYHLGSNIIEGMQFVTPKSTGVECAYSIKNIIARVFGVNADTVQANDYVFLITYRAKDNVRVSISRPDLRKYLLNSDLDAFPIHTQFNQQQDKIVSSDNFGLNAYGKLIRTGNTTYEYLNWCDNIMGTMEAGNLYNIDDQMYYVSKINRVYYSEHIEERVELTQDFNRLAQIIGIPSQPRFYEISERNIIDRDVKFNDYIQIVDAKSSDVIYSGILSMAHFYTIESMFLPTAFPTNVLTIFKGDADKLWNYESNGSVYQVYTPVVTYSSKNTFTIEWDMVDNFSAGDKSTDTGDTLKWSLNLYSLLRNILGEATDDQAYQTREPVRYVDAYGRADLVDFVLFNNYVTTTFAEVKSMPQSDISNFSSRFVRTIDGNVVVTVFGGSNDEACRKLINDNNKAQGMADLLSNTSGYILAKDNRERLSFDYNIQYLLDSDRVVLGNKLWIKDLDTSKVRIALLSKELNKYDSDFINSEDIIALSNGIDKDDILLTEYVQDITLNRYIDIENNLGGFTQDELDSAVAYAVVRFDAINFTNYRLIIGKNISGLDDGYTNFYFMPYDKDDPRYAKHNRGQLNGLLE